LPDRSVAPRRNGRTDGRREIELTAGGEDGVADRLGIEPPLVGGSPVRSNVTRRSSVSLSASPTGFRPFASSAARRKRSISPFGQRSSFTAGTVDLRGGCQAHQSFAAAHASSLPATFAAPSRGSGASICTHFSKSWITASGSLPPDFCGGIAVSLLA
jgi:hypothetical protein